MAQTSFDLQGHRGCRGLMPENTIIAFLKATELRVTTLEMDLVISKDHEIVVSHEPWMSHVICSHPDGTPVKKKEEKTLNLYQMNYDEIRQYDCGMRGNKKFPDQKKMKSVKPTLKEVVQSVEKFVKDKNYPQPKYNIEIKSVAEDYNIFQPEPKEFVKLVLDEIHSLGIEDHTTIQSFDVNILELLNKEPGKKYSIAYLVDSGRKLNSNLSKLTFQPDVYSPAYTLVSERMILECHAKGIKIIPWTINDRDVMKQMKDWGCDGGITDVLFFKN